MTDTVYDLWVKADKELKAAKKKELELRMAICAHVLSDKLEGARTFRDHGFKITATAKLNRSIDREVLETIWNDLTDVEKECIEYKPSLKLAQFKKVEQTGGLLMDAITVKPATPTLTIVEEE